MVLDWLGCIDFEILGVVIVKQVNLPGVWACFFFFIFTGYITNCFGQGAWQRSFDSKVISVQGI